MKNKAYKSVHLGDRFKRGDREFIVAAISGYVTLIDLDTGIQFSYSIKAWPLLAFNEEEFLMMCGQKKGFEKLEL